MLVTRTLVGRPLARAAVAMALAAGVGLLRGQEPPPPQPTPIGADRPADRQGRQASLREQLRVGLKAVTKADLAFIDLVVLRVNEGKLPRKLVDSTFLWARNRYKQRPEAHRLRPIVYFQPALVARAKEIGVKL